MLLFFDQKQLKPATFAGYRTAIADYLDSDGSIVSQSRELNRLIASFHRDKGRQDRAIPSWDLSLVLFSLTKQPFEPLRDSSFKHLTFKTVFLLAWASDKGRSEIHAWTFASVFFNSSRSKVTMAPSPAFLAKNQLPSEGSGSVQVTISGLASFLSLDMRGLFAQIEPCKSSLKRASS